MGAAEKRPLLWFIHSIGLSAAAYPHSETLQHATATPA
jgi:hypothetical protein